LMNGHAILQNCGGWGERKDTMYSALRQLYLKYSIQNETIDANSRVDGIVFSELLPDEQLGQMTVRQYLGASAEEFNLKGRPQDDFFAIKQYLYAHLDEGSREFRSGELDSMAWRDIPLNVPKRAVDFLDRHGLITLEQLRQVVQSGTVTSPQTGDLVVVTEEQNFGEGSLRCLREELDVLSQLGLERYRRGVICSLEDLPDAEMKWRDIPIRFSARIIGFLDRYEIQTVGQVYELATRNQVVCPESNELLLAVEQKNFGETSLTAMRQELSQLAELGLSRYRYGVADKPETVERLVEAVCQLLDERCFSVLRLRNSGLTLRQTADQFDVSRERIRQLEAEGLAKCSGLKQVAQDVLEGLVDGEEGWELKLVTMIAEMS